MVFVSRWHSPNGLINGATNGLVRKDREVKEKDTPGPALEDNGGGAEEGRSALRSGVTARRSCLIRGCSNSTSSCKPRRKKSERRKVGLSRPFARLQTVGDYEVFSRATDILYDAMLRKRIGKLQQYSCCGHQEMGR
ncbi:hypothetical protein V8E52_009711 [Russula decolorans]